MSQISRTDKKFINDFNTLEVRGYTIDRLVQIEYRIDTEIKTYFKPQNLQTFEKVVLNNGA